MKTYVTPIGYDTRRVTRPVLNHGVSADDLVVLLRPATESDTDRAQQTIADVEQLLHEIEPAVEIQVKQVPVDDFQKTILACRGSINAAQGRTVVALGGGARDVLLPLLIAGLVHVNTVDTFLFFSDLNHSVRELNLPDLGAIPSEKTMSTFTAILDSEGPILLSELAEETGVSRSTIVRHVAELEDQGLVRTASDGRAKDVRPTFTSRLIGESFT